MFDFTTADTLTASEADSVLALAERARGYRRVEPGGFNQPRWVMIRSLVFPGWGQAHNGAWLKAGAIAATEVYLIARIVQDYKSLNDLEDQIFASNDPVEQEKLSREYSELSNQYVGRQWWLGALLAYSMVDAYIDAHFRNFDVEFDQDRALPGGSRNAARVRLLWRKKF